MTDHACLKDNAILTGTSRLSGHATLGGNSIVAGHIGLQGKTEVAESVHISGEGILTDAVIKGWGTLVVEWGTIDWPIYVDRTTENVTGRK